jgi:hypothetical protein
MKPLKTFQNDINSKDQLKIVYTIMINDIQDIVQYTK